MIIDRLIFNKHLEKGEKILYAVHRHWVGMLKTSLEIGFFGFVLPWALYMIGFNSTLFFWIAVIWSVLAYVKFLYVLIDWYSDTWLITNMSVITIQWKGVFNNTSSRLGYEDIEGAAYEIKGFWSTILRFGTITIKMMSGNIYHLKNISHPARAEHSIAEFQKKYLNERNMKDTDSLKTLLSNMVAHENKNNH